MKKIFITLLAFSLYLYADLSVEQIQKMVNEIHEKREGIELNTLETTPEPFVRFEQENNVTTFVIPVKEEIKEEKMVLHAIVNGKAYINDAWITEESKILGYTLKFIGKRGVVLRNGNRIKKLFLHKDRDDFIKLKER